MRPIRWGRGVHSGAKGINCRRCGVRGCSADAGRSLTVAALIALSAIIDSGCSSNHSSNWFGHKESSEQTLDRALDGQTPDERRQGVIALADSPDATSDWAMKAFDAIARTDVDPMVRCAAIRGLGRAGDARVVPTLIKLLDSADADLSDVRKTPPVVRWEAAKLLQIVVDRYTYREDQRPEIVRSLIDRANKETDRNVRLTAIDTLAYFAEKPIPEVMTACLEADDFAVRHAAERTLIALTGETHNHDADAWRSWLGEHPDPFAGAGRTPPEPPHEKSASKPWWPW